MAENEDFASLLAEVLAGSEEASQRFLAEYGPRLLHAVRKNLPNQLRAQFDSLDFVQDVWASFFAMEDRRTFTESDALIAFLTRVAKNKVVDVIRQRNQVKRRHIEEPLPDGSKAAAAIPQLRDPDPTPSTIAMNEEEWEKMLKSQPPAYRRILLLLRQGKTPKEVAQEIGVSERTVCRVVSRVSSRMSLLSGEW